ncbi:MAG: hypothetical protein IKQ60_06765 [Candidatus Methanomethylophilaceae archaeon]|nr:hypothetical protein [Candidatus Methanomethylophilaceae archaeon]
MAEEYASPEAIFATAASMPASERMRWLEVAAVQGHPAAQYELANELVALNMTTTPQSMKWFLCSAASGFPEACSAIAYYILSKQDCLDMIGKKATVEDALKLAWYAAASGEQTALKNLRTLSASGLCSPLRLRWKEAFGVNSSARESAPK